MSDYPEPTEEAEEAPVEAPFVAWEPEDEDVPEVDPDDFEAVEVADETVVGSAAHRNLADTLAAEAAAKAAE